MGVRALNATKMKQLNEKKILDQIRIHPISRAELARKTGLTRSAVSVIVDNLLQKELIMEGDPLQTKVGRNSITLKLNKNKYFVVGIDIARDYCSIGFSDFSGKLLESTRICLMNNKSRIDKILNNIVDCTKKIMKLPSCKGQLLGIGVTAPGPLDTKQGVILNPPNFKEWRQFPIVDYLKEKFNCFVTLENNAKALALAEKYYGIGNQFKSYMELLVDTGVGGEIILNESLYQGVDGFGCDLGHITININGPKCNCGNYGCSELYASIPNIILYAKQLDSRFCDWNTIIDLARKSDVNALKIVKKEATYLAALVTTTMNLLDVETIIIAGDINYDGELINSMIESIVNKHFIGRDIKKVSIHSSKLGNQANLLSCVNLVMESFTEMQN